MLGEFLINFSVFFQYFFLSFFKATNNLVGSVFFNKFSVNYEKLLLMFYVLNSDRIKITFSVSQMINAVEYVGFSDAVTTDKTVDFSFKIKIDFRKIFVIKKV